MEHHGSPWQSPDKEATSTTAPGMITDSVQTMTPVSSPTLFSASLPSLELSPPKAAPMLRRTSCDLFECIEQHSRFSEETSKFVFAQIVEVVWALGKIGICHRDIKDENIVVSSDFRVSAFFEPRKLRY
jgi:serine/threonine protein kinase